MIFAQFYNRKLDGTTGPALGSDSVLPMDGRLNKRSCAAIAHKHAAQLNAGLKKGYVAFTLEAGTYGRSRTILGLTYVVTMAERLEGRTRGLAGWNMTEEERRTLARSTRNGAGLSLKFRDGSRAFIRSGSAAVEVR